MMGKKKFVSKYKINYKIKIIIYDLNSLLFRKVDKEEIKLLDDFSDDLCSWKSKL